MRSWLVWAIYGLCVLLAIDGLAWLTYRAVQAEQLRAEARAAVIRQQRVQLVLWRMDSALARMLRAEAGRPAESYRAFPDPQRLNHPSPLLLGAPPPMKLHFVWSPSMGWQSPQVPDASLREHAQRLGVDPARIAISERWLSMVRERLGPDPRASKEDLALAALSVDADQNAEFRARRQSVAIEPQGAAKDLAELSQDAASRMNTTADTSLQALWLQSDADEPMLILLRETMVQAEQGVVGVWVDWSSLQALLAAEVVDLMPSATLSPLIDTTAPAIDRLALIPARINAPSPAVSGSGMGSEAWTAIGVSWLAVLAAVLAVGVVLRQALLLSERRAHFASAVSHELRTPLTSLRLQADLMQRSEPRTLIVREQVQRLEAIVESVLTYAGVRRAASIEPIHLGRLMETILPEARARIEQTCGRLETETDQAEHLWVWADATLLRRIIDNLIENACTHAKTEASLVVRMEIEAHGSGVVLHISDNGPGIPRGQRRTVFRPFVGGRAGGLGLGLALARQAAQSMRGRLRLIDGPGAVFELTLRRAERVQ